MRRDIVVVGGSAGGMDALRAILAQLPRDFPAAVCAVLHTSPDSPGILGAILGQAGPLQGVTVRGEERLEAGRIYVARPDHHLLVEPSTVRVSRGPRENRFRPAIDPLFRSAAQTYGPRVVGVILSGGLDDGAAGLWTVKRMGGLAVVQDPEEAIAPSMPRSALAQVNVDHCLPAAAIAPLLVRAVSEDLAEKGGYTVPETTRIEVDIAKEVAPIEAGVRALGDPSTFACPECHGVLLEVKEGGRARFRCHTGHAYSAESLVAEYDQAIEASLWNSVRALQEKAILLRDLAGHAREHRDAPTAEALRRRAEEAQRRAERVRQATMEEADRAAE